MSIATKTQTTIILLKTNEAIQWINDNISLAQNQWNKDDDTGYPTIEINTQFVDELLDSMADELTNNDFEVVE